MAKSKAIRIKGVGQGERLGKQMFKFLKQALVSEMDKHNAVLHAKLTIDYERNGEGWRCGECNKIQPIGSSQIWVPDDLRITDPLWHIEKRALATRSNGQLTAWCLDCAYQLTQNK